MFYREGAGFAVEEVRQYGPNVISFKVVSGRRRWYIVGCYLAPDDAQGGVRRDRERTRNGSGRGGQVRGRRGRREKEKPLVGSPKTQ